MILKLLKKILKKDARGAVEVPEEVLTPVLEQSSGSTQLILFLENKGGCVYGRRLSDIWRWDNDRLESCHTYIQWLFPTDIESSAIPGSPVLTKEELEHIRVPCAAQANMRASFGVFLCFLGLERKEGGFIERGDFESRAEIWLSDNNHNYLRISRVLRSLSLAGLNKEAGALYDFLHTLYLDGREIGAENLSFWQDSLKAS